MVYMEQLSQFILENLPAILCLMSGFVLVVVEMFIPGFGLPGISGIILLLCVALSISLRSAAKGRLSRSSLVLSDVLDGKASEVSEMDLKFFIGHEGVACCVLRPAGIAEFDGVKLNVVSDGEFIESGVPVRVERVEGNRIVVRPIESAHA